MAASSALPMPEAWSGERVPGGKKARIAACVSAWLTKSTAPSFSTPRLAVSPVSSMSRRSIGRARSARLVRRRKAEPTWNAPAPTCQCCAASSNSTMRCACSVTSTR